MYLKTLTTNRPCIEFDSNTSLSTINNTFDYYGHFHEKIDEKQDKLVLLQNQLLMSGVMKK